MRAFSALLAGLLFGAGVTISGMVNPMKVLNFMDVPGLWDPSLAFVMGAGLAVTLVGYRLVFMRKTPLLDGTFHLPMAALVDAKLLGGAALFGLGWGLSGFCPGPAIASVVFGHTESLLFVASMTLATVVTRLVLARTATSPQSCGR